MCNGPLYVDSFSAFKLLRDYNRITAPTDLHRYHNLNLIKNFERNSPIVQPQILSSNPLRIVLNQNQLNDPRRIINKSTSPNRTILSSKRSPTPKDTNICENDLFNGFIDPQNTNSQIDGIDDDRNITLNNLRLQDPAAASLIKSNLIGTDLPSIEHFQCILNRRQRGEKRPIPDEQKDEKYFERRKRNNEAAKKSRDARKMREDRIALRAALLEQENAILKAQIFALREELLALQQMICNRSNI